MTEEQQRLVGTHVLRKVAAWVVTWAALSIARNATEMAEMGIIDPRSNVGHALLGAWVGR